MRLCTWLYCLLFVLFAGWMLAGMASARDLGGLQRHVATCLRGEIAVCAQPVSMHSQVAIRSYRMQERGAWRIAFDVASGMLGRSRPVCACTRRIRRVGKTTVLLTCTCTGK